MKWTIIILLLILFITEKNYAQGKFPINHAPLLGTVTVEEIKNDFSPSLFHFDEVNPAFSHQKEKKVIDKIAQTKQRKNDSRSVIPAPIIHKSFEAPSTYLAAPNDNDIAISNDGYIISVLNSEIHILDTTGTQLKVISLSAFADTLKLSGGKFDPRVIYDPVEDRFIIIFLSGVKANDSYIVVAFSKTNNPLQSWNFYSFAGNILNDSSAADFPIVAISKQELFINVSNYDENDFSYDSYTYKGTRLFQIKKKDGYEGRTLNYIHHYDFEFEKNIPRKNNFSEIHLVQGGSKPYGPNMFMLAGYDSRPVSDTLYLLEITDTIGSPNFEIKTTTLKTDIPYHLPPVAKQTGTHRLYTNFNSILSSFYENGMIQFVKNDSDLISGNAGIYHGFIKNIGSTNNISTNIIGYDTLDIAYPSLAYTGKSSTDDDASISFNHSSQKYFPGNSALFYKDGSYSDMVMLKKGESIINYSPGLVERWGDYTGSQRKYNGDNEVWIGASFGRSSRGRTWISCLRVNEYAASSKQLNKDVTPVRLYPNPASEIFSIEFISPETERCRFELFDEQGKSVHLLLNDIVEKGKNTFTFNQSPLASGIYFLNVTNEKGNILVNRKILFQK